MRVIGAIAAVAAALALVITPQLPAHAAGPEPATDLDGTCAILRTGSGASTHATRGSASSKITAAKPMIESQAEGAPRQPRVARAWM